MAENEEPVRLGKRRVRPPLQFAEQQAEWLAQPKKTRRKVPPEEKAMKRKNTKTGKLRRAIDNVPVEILHHILAWCPTQTLTRLTRTCKMFRSVLLAKSNRSIWLEAFSREGLPKLTGPLSEPRVSALIWDKQCSKCALDKVYRIDFCLQRRLCDACTKSITIDEHDWRLNTYNRQVREVALHGHTTSSGLTAWLTADLESWHQAWRLLFIETQDVARDALEATWFAFSDPVLRSNELWYADAKALTIWSEEHTTSARDDKNTARRQRVDSIRSKLVSEENVPQDLVDRFFREGCDLRVYRKTVDQPYPLTDRVWRKIRPALLEAIEEFRRFALAMEGVDPARAHDNDDAEAEADMRGVEDMYEREHADFERAIEEQLEFEESLRREAERAAEELEREALERQREEEEEAAWIASVVDDFERLSTL